MCVSKQYITEDAILFLNLLGNQITFLTVHNLHK